MQDISIKNEEKSNFLGLNKKMIVSSALFMLLGMIIGYFFLLYSQTSNKSSFEFFKEADFIGKRPTFTNIFFHNLIVGFLLYLGCIYGKMITRFLLIINGISFGIVIASYFFTDISSMVLLSLVPHGIFEIPCLIICGAYGLEKKKIIDIKNETIKLGIIIAIFALAAIIEVYVSYPLSKRLG